MRVSDVMSRNVLTIPPTASLDEAREVMRLKRVHHLVITDHSRPIGVISAHDLEKTAGRYVVAEIMKTHVITTSPDATIGKAANLMRGHAVGSLVVTDRKKTVGIVTVSDLLDLLGRGAGRQPVGVARAAIHYRVPHVKQHRAGRAW